MLFGGLLIGQRYSSRLSYDISGAVPVQKLCYCIETGDSVDKYPPFL
jgi:hypothetical protein